MRPYPYQKCLKLGELMGTLFEQKRSFFPFFSPFTLPASDRGDEAPDFVEVITYELRAHDAVHGSRGPGGLEDEFVWLLALLALRLKSGSRLVSTLGIVCVYTCKYDGIVWASEKVSLEWSAKSSFLERIW